MRTHLIFAIIVLSLLASAAPAQYWFQSGAAGTQKAEYNSGASVSIETVTPQHISTGSFGYWIGELLSNGAFIQVGYEIPNQSGYYQTNCTLVGCGGRVYLTAGRATWFWEYFLANASSSTFLGAIGGDGSAGANGTFNTYSFRSSGDIWSAYVDNTTVGVVNLGAPNSGSHTPEALAEDADTDVNTTVMPLVLFKNLEFYNGQQFLPVPGGQSVVSYGVLSARSLKNPYGVAEYNDYVNYFKVGSGVPVQPAERLWSLGYSLTVASVYGEINSTTNYTPYSTVQFSAPSLINLTPSKRLAFAGWVGSGAGSYTGPDRNASITMYQNTTELAQWATQYYINVSSKFGLVTGAGWLAQNTTTSISIDANSISAGTGTRAVFSGWSNGDKNSTFTVKVSAPLNASVDWDYQYLLNATSPYGTTTGSGWYVAGQKASLSVSETSVQLSNDTKAQFVGWSNGDENSTTAVTVASPLLLSARFDKEFLVNVNFENAYGEPIEVGSFDVNGVHYSGASAYVDPSLSLNEVNYAYWKGTVMPVNYSIRGITGPANVSVILPVYNITISAKGEFGLPVNATARLTFRNGTNGTFYTGPKGTLTIANVPYGYATGYLSYIGQTRQINASYGGITEENFITPLSALAVLAGIAAVLIIEVFYFREKRARWAASHARRRRRR